MAGDDGVERPAFERNLGSDSFSVRAGRLRVQVPPPHPTNGLRQREFTAMIRRLQFLRNIGLFDSVAAGATIALAPLTLIYAENGRGPGTTSARRSPSRSWRVAEGALALVAILAPRR